MDKDRDKPYTLEIGYVCIFTKTTEEAAKNLLRFILSRQRQFADEGAAAWRDILQVHLSPPDELCQLNQAGASFTAAEWRLILTQVHAELLTEAG